MNIRLWYQPIRLNRRIHRFSRMFIGEIANKLYFFDCVDGWNWMVLHQPSFQTSFWWSSIVILLSVSGVFTIDHPHYVFFNGQIWNIFNTLKYFYVLSWTSNYFHWSVVASPGNNWKNFAFEVFISGVAYKCFVEIYFEISRLNYFCFCVKNCRYLSPFFAIT